MDRSFLLLNMLMPLLVYCGCELAQDALIEDLFSMTFIPQLSKVHLNFLRNSYFRLKLDDLHKNEDCITMATNTVSFYYDSLIVQCNSEQSCIKTNTTLAINHLSSSNDNYILEFNNRLVFLTKVIDFDVLLTKEFLNVNVKFYKEISTRFTTLQHQMTISKLSYYNGNPDFFYVQNYYTLVTFICIKSHSHFCKHFMDYINSLLDYLIEVIYRDTDFKIYCTQFKNTLQWVNFNFNYIHNK